MAWKRMMTEEPVDKRAPMASAPLQYRENGEVAWGEMWDSFCALALDGGPPHRGELLTPQAEPQTASDNYQFAVREILRGIQEVSALPAREIRPGWIGITCATPSMATWLAEAVIAENVTAHAEDALLCVPVGDFYTVKGEIKNVITAVAKTTHYWADHVPPQVKQTLVLQEKLALFTNWVRQHISPTKPS